MFKKSRISLVSILFIAAQVPVFSTHAAFAAARMGFGVLKTSYRVGAPIVKKGVQHIKPLAEKFARDPRTQQAVESAKVWAAQNPKGAAMVAGGAAVGYATSGDGIVNTVTGTGLGALAGLSISTQAARLALQESLVCAVNHNLALQSQFVAVVGQARAAQTALTAALAREQLLKKSVVGLEAAGKAAHAGRARALAMARSTRSQLSRATRELNTAKQVLSQELVKAQAAAVELQQASNAASAVTKPVSGIQSWLFQLTAKGPKVAPTESLTNGLVPVV